MTSQDLANLILRAGEKGYKDREEGFRISHEMTLLIKEHINHSVDSVLQKVSQQIDDLETETEVTDLSKGINYACHKIKHQVFSLQTQNHD